MNSAWRNAVVKYTCNCDILKLNMSSREKENESKYLFFRNMEIAPFSTQRKDEDKLYCIRSYYSV